MDSFLALVGFVANLAAIVTSIIAVWAWLRFKSNHKDRVVRLEEYLKDEKRSGDYGQRTTLHLMANLGMTEAQVLEAALNSKHVHMVPGQDEQGRANRIFFEYTTGDAEKDLMLEGRGTKKRVRAQA